MRLTVAVIAIGLAAGSIGASASAQQAAQQSSNREAPIEVNGKKTPDMNEVVCEKERDTSSRLIFNKVCMTRSQWAEQRRLDRQSIDQAQMQQSMPH